VLEARAKRAREDHADLLPEVLELRWQGLGVRAIAEKKGVSATTGLSPPAAGLRDGLAARAQVVAERDCLAVVILQLLADLD
jgi:hypothetical protein